MKKWPDDVVNRFKCWWDNCETNCGETHVNCRDCPFHVPGYSMQDAVKDAIGWFYRLQAAQPKWISVEERLPLEDGQCVLCAVKDYWGVAVCEGCYSKVSNRIWPNDEDCVLDEVTHWMPLPEPPKEETDERNNENPG